MSIKSLFNNKTKVIENATSASAEVESKDYVLERIKRDETFIPYIDFASASNFAKFGSAEEYYKKAIERIHDDYPYDGSQKEKLQFELSSSYLDKYILDKRYPKTNGYINFSYGGWGTQSSIADGYGLPSSTEFIFMRGGIHAADGMDTQDLRLNFDKSIKYDSSKNRITSLLVDPTQGFTVEFWLKKDSFDLAKTNKEVILDLWNSEASSSSDYGRFTLALSGTTSGQDTFIVTLQSGSSGFYEQSIGTTTVTTSSLSSWHHYALSFVSASSAITGRLYVDGDLNESKSLGATGLNAIGGRVNGYIGALQTSPSGSSAVAYAGKLSASLDDFRYWKTRRTSKQIYDNWYRHVGGGANTDDANTKLGIYYKFNEGIVGNSTADSTVLDYSGRLVNGSWTGYTSGARSTDSAFVESGLVASEEQDPIIYSSHSEVSSLKTELMASGSTHDEENASLLYNKIPSWIRNEDAGNDNATKHLVQILASYFDTLHAQITALPYLKNKVYPSSSYKPVPFARDLLEDKGLITANLFADASVLEMFEDRDVNQIKFEEKITDVKNQIYTNIYNNLESIYKHKGTEGSIRNMLRCFGIDDEIVKLNIYTDEGTHYFSDAFKHTNVNKKFVDFSIEEHNSATVFNETSSLNPVSYISGSGTEKLEQYNALTSEISIIVPKKAGYFDPGYYKTPFLSASVFGMHQATTSGYTWASPDLANFQVYLVRDELESSNAKFVLKDYAGNINLETDVYKEIYSNEHWNLAVRIKPEDYPIAGNVVTSSNRDYTLEFYGVSHAFDTVKEEFLLTASLNYDTGSAYLSNLKRFYVGAHKTNFVSTTLEQTDIKVGKFNVWLDYVDNDAVKLHNKDITSKGIYRTHRPSTIFGKDLEQYEVPSYELAVLDWDFETVTTSDSFGEFIVIDTTSGSTDSRYGWVDGVTRRRHDAVGYDWPNSTTDVIKNEIIYASKKELPEISYSSDGVTIKGEQEEYFIEDEDVSDNFYALEKSMNQVISEEMMRTLSTAQEMSNLMGEAVERYRMNYKKLDNVRRMFFEDVEEDPDFDHFTEYFKFIDSAMSYMISQMFPVSVRFSKGISDVVESHLFERNKYQNKFPLITTHTATEGSAFGIGQSKYRWEFGHAPLSGDDNDNCLWQKTRAEREDITERETIKNIINNRNNATATTVANQNRTTYTRSNYGIRNFSKPVDMKAIISQTFHPGINYSLQKDRDYVWTAINRHSELTSIGVPKNVLVIGAGEGQGIELPTDCNDVEIPNQKKKYNTTVYVGKEAIGAPGLSFSPINDSASYSYAVKGAFKLPFDIFSGSVNSGYNADIVSGYRSDAILTNLHIDTTNFSNDVPLQSPFTQQWVGGHQTRHIDLNRYDVTLIDGESLSAPPNNIHNLYTRPEGWLIKVVETGPGSDGAIGMVDPQYGVTAIPGHPNNGNYPDVAKKVATFYRDLRTKRPVNISNIQTTTSSVNHGNFSKTYEIMSIAGGVHENNFYLRDNPEQDNYLHQNIIDILPQTTHPMTLFGQDPGENGNVFGTYQNNRQPDGALLSPEITGVAASGSFTVTGSYITGSTASNSSFRIYSATGSQFQNLEAIRIVDGAANDDRFFFLTGAYGPPYVDGAPNYYVVTGASDTQFWDNIEANIEAQTPFSVSYSAVTPPDSEGLYISTAANRVSINTGSLPTQFTASSFTFSGWIAISSSATDRYIFQFENTSGDVSRELFVSSSGELTYRAYGANGANRCTASWGYVNFEADNVDTLVHVAVVHNMGGGFPGSVDMHINTQTQTLVSALIASSAGACTGATFITSSGGGSILNNISTNLGLIGSASNFSFWSDGLSQTQVEHVYNGGHYFDVLNGSYCAFPALDNDRIAWFPMRKITNAGDEEIFSNTFTFGNPDGHATNNSGPPQLPYANFTVTPPGTGSIYNTTLSNSGFGSVVTCGTVTNLSNGTGGVNYQGAYPSGSITLDDTFVMAATATSPSIAVPEFTGGSNSAFWNALSQSIKDNTDYDTITVTDNGNGTATFNLTASVTGSSYNNTITRAGPNANLTFTSLSGFAGGVDYAAAVYGTDIVIDRITSSVTDAVFTTRFAAPGGIEIESYGYLDAYAHEYSIYNSLNYRNLTVRGINVRMDPAKGYAFGGSGEEGTIRMDNHLGQRDSHKALLTRHCGKYGTDTRQTAYSVITNPNIAESLFQTAVNRPSFHKQQRNENRRPSDTSTVLSPVLVKRHDNMYINSPIPRSDFQYKWVTSSIGSNYSITSGKQRMYGYAHPTGIMSSSAVIDGDSGFVPAITFPTASEIFGE